MNEEFLKCFMGKVVLVKMIGASPEEYGELGILKAFSQEGIWLSGVGVEQGEETFFPMTSVRFMTMDWNKQTPEVRRRSMHSSDEP
jgi:hypothetical protein